MTEPSEITLTLAEHKHGTAFGLLVFCRAFDGQMAEICVGATGQDNRVAMLGFGDFLLYPIGAARHEVRLIEARSSRSDPQAVIRISRLPDTKEEH